MGVILDDTLVFRSGLVGYVVGHVVTLGDNRQTNLFDNGQKSRRRSQDTTYSVRTHATAESKSFVANVSCLDTFQTWVLKL